MNIVLHRLVEEEKEYSFYKNINKNVSVNFFFFFYEIDVKVVL